MVESQTHGGGCHCGAVRFEASVDLTNVISCNCSICQKRGLIISFIPASVFKLLAGDQNLIDYQFGKMTIHHLFCSNCGVSAFARGNAPDGAEMIAVNVRCLDDVDLAALSPKPFDGKSL